jgi:hypothetical protein
MRDQTNAHAAHLRNLKQRAADRLRRPQRPQTRHTMPARSKVVERSTATQLLT